MDIVLNATFNNPSLPVVESPGFTDSFERASSNTLGVTDDGKNWQTIDIGANPSVWGPNGDGTASMKTAGSSWQLAGVDGLASNGTLTGVVGPFTGTRWGGLAFRILDGDNHIRVAELSGSSARIALQQRLAGVTTSLGSSSSGVEVVPGDVITAQFIGDQITVFLNDVSVITGTATGLTGMTNHGLYAQSTAVTSWDSISFTPA